MAGWLHHLLSPCQYTGIELALRSPVCFSHPSQSVTQNHILVWKNSVKHVNYLQGEIAIAISYSIEI